MKQMVVLTVFALLQFGIVAAKPMLNETALPTSSNVTDNELPTYYLNSRLLNWLDALDQCVRLGRSLATIRNEAEAKHFKAWLRRTGDYAKSYWMGGMYAGSPRCDAENTVKACWNWVDSDFNPVGGIDIQALDFTFIGDVQGTFTSRTAVVRDRYDNLNLGSDDDTAILKYICETRPSSCCDCK